MGSIPDCSAILGQRLRSLVEHAVALLCVTAGTHRHFSVPSIAQRVWVCLPVLLAEYPVSNMRASSVASRSGPCARAARAAPACHAQPKDSCAHSLGRRGALASLLALTAAQHPAHAEAELVTLYGLATPPTSYGGYGGNVKEAPKYKFDYPEGWKQLTVNKVQKGTQGIDCIVQEGRNKQSRAFVVTLARAGEDNKSFKLTDLDSTFQSFVGADYDLQDAVGSADEITSSRREVEGQVFYDYLVPGSDAVYRASITVNGGKVFALFVSSPARTFKSNETTIDKMIESFRTL
eukprot:jgi/Ulvmu1/12336/UM089_0020.1